VHAVLQNCKYAVARDVLPDGTVIPPGSQVIYSPYVVNRMEAFWGPDALAFRPERWLEMEATPTPYHYLTFNAGGAAASLQAASGCLHPLHDGWESCNCQQPSSHLVKSGV